MLPLALMPAVAQEPSMIFNPLTPLIPNEMAWNLKVLKEAGKADLTTKYPLIDLVEPPKDVVLRFKPGENVARKVFTVLFDPAHGKTSEAVVDLSTRKLISFRELPGVQPPIMMSEIERVTQIVRSDGGWQAAIKKRGITDFEHVQLDPWSAGMTLDPDEESRRIVRAVAHYQGAKQHNAYGHPIEGVVAYVDLNENRVYKLVDTGVIPVPKTPADLDEKSVGTARAAPRPLDILQRQGPSFEVSGNAVRWQKWHFRFSMHPREGLVLHTVGYDDGGKVRQVLYRANLSEMYVPYGDPSTNWAFRNVFDEGEYGIGRLAGSLEPQTDVPPNAVFFDALFADSAGQPFLKRNAVALYERDGGLLWKHNDGTDSGNQSRRARDLVLTSISTVGNYDYGFSWVFHQDGSLEMEVQLTGIMQPRAVDASSKAHTRPGEPNGHLVAPGIVGVPHQHFFNFRIDMDVEGARANRVVEINTVAQPGGPDNPSMTGMLMQETPLRTESEGQRDVNMATGRKWKIENTAVKNALGQPVGYLLVPEETTVPLAAPDSWYRKRAGFINHHLWVTPFDASQESAAGSYPNQGKGGEGLPKWVEGNRPIDNTDVVLWYTFGITHTPRPEEWPVMPVHRAGFKLIPSGFFARNPALDVPRPWLPATAPVLDAVSVDPFTGNGPTQTFKAVYTDPKGAADLQVVYLNIGSTAGSAHGCWATYVRASNALFLYNDTSSEMLGPITPGAIATVSNSQCTLSGGGGRVAVAGNSLTVPFAITFTAGFSGTHNIYGLAQSYSGTRSPWQSLGTWTP